MKAILYKQDGTTKEISPMIIEQENKTIVRILMLRQETRGIFCQAEV